MKLKLTLLSGVAIATLCGAMLTPAIAGDDDYYTSNGRAVYDDQADETRALNQRALDDARDQNNSARYDEDRADEPRDGQGGPEFQGPPGPNDYGDDQDDDDDQPDAPDDMDD